MKRLLVLFVIVLIMLLTSAKGYSLRCTKCWEDCKSHRGNPVGIATRQWGEPNVKRDGHVYGWYRCSYGHHYLVDLGLEE